MKVRELLTQCRTVLTEITAIERQIDRLMTTGAPSSGSSSPRREKIKGSDEYIVVGGNTNNPEAARMQAAEGCEAVLLEKKKALSEMLTRMEKLLEMLSDGNARTILRYYYGVGWTDERISEEMEMARQTVTNKRNAAVDYLEAVTKNSGM